MAIGDRLNRPVVEAVVSSGITIGTGQNCLDFIGTFVAGNTFDITINGVAIVQAAFATTHDAMIRLIATRINALASVNAYAVKSTSGNMSRVLIEGATVGLTLTYTGLTIAGGATQPAGTIQATSGSLQVQPALYVLPLAGGGSATEATLLDILAQVTSKMDRVKGASNYSRAFTYAAAFGAAGGANVTQIVHTGTTVVGAETITETITYVNPLVDGQQITNIVYS